MPEHHVQRVLDHANLFTASQYLATTPLASGSENPGRLKRLQYDVRLLRAAGSVVEHLTFNLDRNSTN